eukprot:741970_1
MRGNNPSKYLVMTLLIQHGVERGLELNIQRSVDVHESGHRALKSSHEHRRTFEEAIFRIGHFDDDFAGTLRKVVANERRRIEPRVDHVDVWRVVTRARQTWEK